MTTAAQVVQHCGRSCAYLGLGLYGLAQRYLQLRRRAQSKSDQIRDSFVNVAVALLIIVLNLSVNTYPGKLGATPIVFTLTSSMGDLATALPDNTCITPSPTMTSAPVGSGT